MPAPTAAIDHSEVDEWAVDIVVREHARMNLNYSEQIVAVERLKREQNLGDERIADILRIPVKDVETMVRRVYRRAPDLRRNRSKSQAMS